MTALALPYGFVAELEEAPDVVLTERVEGEVPRADVSHPFEHRHVCWSCREGWSHYEDAGCIGVVNVTCPECEVSGPPEPWWVRRRPLGTEDF